MKPFNFRVMKIQKQILEKKKSFEKNATVTHLQI